MRNRSETAGPRKATARVRGGAGRSRGKATRSVVPSLLAGVAVAGLAAMLTLQSGGGVPLSLLAYSLSGAIAVVTTASAISAIARAGRWVRAPSYRRHGPATAFPL